MLARLRTGPALKKSIEKAQSFEGYRFTVYECFQIIKSFLLHSDAYKTNNDSHKNKKKSFIKLLSFQSVHLHKSRMEQTKIGEVDILEAI